MDQRMLQRMMKQAKDAQREMQKMLEALDAQVFQHVYGANHIVIEITGGLVVKKVTINKELLEDAEMLQDVLPEAISEAIALVQAERNKIEEKMSPGAFK